jgi:hypothetical protein
MGTKGKTMSKQDDNKAVVSRWFDKFWGKTCDLSIVDEIASPDMLLKYSLHEPLLELPFCASGCLERSNPNWYEF